MYDLLDAAVSGLLGRPVRARSALSFTTETGAAVLAAGFSDVVLHRHEVPLAFPSPRSVVAYLGSIREPVISHVGEPLDFDAVLDQVAARVERAAAALRSTSRSSKVPRCTSAPAAVATALAAVGPVFQERREYSRRRQAVIDANPELRERELIKLATLASAIA
ncbi:MAG: hypothetical protein ACLPKE_33350, partial [Streptosporangiaceae bacterium]